MRKIIFLLLIFLNISFLYSSDKFLPEKIYLVLGNNVNVREKPDIKSKVITKLKIADRVKMIKKSNYQYNNGNIIGNWVFIDTNQYNNNERNETYKGWVLDYYLVGNDQFKVVNEFYKLKLEGYYGDYYICYEFNRDGSYKQKYYDMYIDRQKKDVKFYNGILYGYKNIFITRSIIGVEVFYILDNKICVAYTDVCSEIIK
jgi:hypothetical protein